MEVFGVVYLILNKVNGKRYVGQTVQPLKKRFDKHAKCDKMLIGKAIQKYGRENFYCGVIKTCASKAEMDYWEKYFIIALKSKVPYGYNMTDGGEGTVGLERTPEHRAHLSAALSGEKNPHYGKKNTPEHTARIVAANLGAKRSPEACKNIAEALKGKPFTLERCANISAAKREESPFKNLTAELVARNLSYAALEKLTGIAHLSEKMRGHRKFTARDKIKLEELLGKPADYLLECDPEVLANFSSAKPRNSPYKNLIAELDKRHMSYTALAKLMDLSQSNISGKMNDKSNFTEHDKDLLEEIFDKPIEYLLERSDF